MVEVDHDLPVAEQRRRVCEQLAVAGVGVGDDDAEALHVGRAMWNREVVMARVETDDASIWLAAGVDIFWDRRAWCLSAADMEIEFDPTSRRSSSYRPVGS